MAAELRLGTSGYLYRHWRGDFYPTGLPVRLWFEHYAQTFDTVELNATFYRLPEADVFTRWRAAAPAGFCYAVKYSQYGTHRKKLLDPETHVPRFVERARRLGPTLGPILVQLPPRWDVDLERLDGFLTALPTDLSWVIEIRDARWLTGPVLDRLRSHRISLCLHDLVADHPLVVTGPLVYLRFHGVRYGGRYGPARLAPIAGRIEEWLADGLPVFAYFNNDIGGHAIHDALSLRGMVGALASIG